MKKNITWLTASAFIFGLSLFSSARGAVTTPDNSVANSPARTADTYRTIMIRPAQTISIPTEIPKHGHLIFAQQPESQTVMIGSNATFSVVAVRIPHFSTNEISYQWQINPVQLNGNLYWTNIPGATNYQLAIPSPQTTDVGFYRVIVKYGQYLTNTSDPTPLVLCIPGSLTVVGTPVVVSPPKNGCNGTYVGYVGYANYPNSQGGWGFIPIAFSGSAQDARSNTTREEGDGSWGDQYCGNNGSVSIPTLFSPGYAFTIYFPSNPVPTGNYTNVLTGFKQ